ncbi:hypothetical protein E0K93_06515 [Puniceibacterium sp. HSS470]|uniref:hypothetical protein n=1 Tax=Pseudooceanicola sediminis TaxID=2211117 RepID=UPI0011C3E313|nr:hypothetical protein [Pseudooceanicola sediminis]KAA2315500.1 hypothetical protein E0K93_06515 [Puniceibacterium sp. HSS470]
MKKWRVPVRKMERWVRFKLQYSGGAGTWVLLIPDFQAGSIAANGYIGGLGERQVNLLAGGIQNQFIRLPAIPPRGAAIRACEKHSNLCRNRTL